MNNPLLAIFEEEVAVDREIQVNGMTCFPQNRWREGILYYLFGIWSDKVEVTYRPKIHFGFACLRLSPGERQYYAYGKCPDTEKPSFPEEGVLTVSWEQTEVEQGLIRFVKNEAIKMLVVTLKNHRQFCLWKKERRGEYGCWANIPIRMEDVP